MADGNHSKVKLNVRVPPQKKEEWRDALDDGESLTSLVRRAVDREIRDEYIHRDSIEELNRDVTADIDLGEITTQLDTLQDAVSAIHERLDDDEAPGTFDEGEVSRVAMNSVEHIPTLPIPERMQEEYGGNPSISEKLELARRRAAMGEIDGRAETIADKLDEPPALTRQALIYVETNTTEPVHSVVEDGDRHWVRL
ncbi:hypothetical protein GJ633_00385 [Halorubrum sp. CBA1125]|uniref:hypothetical protein n=1 Tax=Halorubrum sp. CBA1125 TaxID=2668072 RepID=UPI0012E7404D|nr:hypothetical protein [Halorubrum sp. CBA1125]MUW13274.1 hypothetical protein [Halorubrum sp. CBA1125]